MNLDFRPKLSQFYTDRRGGVAVMFSVAAIPLLFFTGAAIDYSRAARIRTQLMAFSDAAALTATTPTMMEQSSSNAQTAATNMFAAQAKNLNGLNYDSTQLTVAVTDTPSGTSFTRNVAISYNAKVTNPFGIIDRMGLAQTDFTVSTQVSTAAAPNINFYVLVDNSPSMEIPATTTDIATLQTKTGCAFACHESNFKDSELSVHYPGWGSIDSYTYAENTLKIPLRIDNVRAAVANLASTAYCVSTGASFTSAASSCTASSYGNGNGNGATYGMAVFAFNDGFSQVSPTPPAKNPPTYANLLSTSVKNNVTTIQSNIATLTPPIMASNNNLAAGNIYVYPTSTGYKSVTLTSSLPDDDASTNFEAAMTNMNAQMPAPGNGSTKTGDTPQETLLIVTDGVDDATMYSSSSCNSSSHVSYSNTYGSFTRCMQPVDTSYCTTIKNRGIRIAVLYTTYNPMTSNSWYTTYIAPLLGSNNQVRTNLQSCASSPELFSEVATNGDITAAINNLFSKAVTTAPYISQ